MARSINERDIRRERYAISVPVAARHAVVHASAVSMRFVLIFNRIIPQYTFFNPSSNPGVAYKYYVKSGGTAGYTPKYLWDFVEWSTCSAKCNGGTMIAEASCIEQQSGVVSPNFCQNIPRPEAKSRICNEQKCPAKWRVSQWSKCSACDGKKGNKHRKVQCVKPAAHPGGDDVQANLDACKGKVPKQTEECVGTRPCRKMCPKKTRDCMETELSPMPEVRAPSLTEQRRMIDEFVDLGIARYLEKTRRQAGNETSNNKTIKRDVSEDFKSMLRDWMMIGNREKDKRTCQKDTGKSRLFGKVKNPQQQALGDKDVSQQRIIAGSKRFTTPKPGSIVKDVVKPNEIVLYEAPLRDELLKANVSDIGFQEGGDVIPIGIDTRQEKVYRGAQAAKIIAELTHRNASKGNQDSEDRGGSTAASTTTTTTDGSAPGLQGSNKTTVTSTSTATPKS